MTWSSPPGAPTRYGRNTPVTAPGPASRQMLKRIREIQRSPLNFLLECWQQHGDVVQFPIPRPATYLVSSPQGARDVLVQNHKVMSKRTIQYNSLSLVTGEGLLTADTATWKTSRRQLAPAFHHEMISLARQHVADALARLDAHWTELTAHGSVVVDIDQTMMNVALEITGATLFGSDLSDQVEVLTSATLRALHGVVVKARFPLPIPLSIPTPNNLGMRRAIKQLDKAVNAIIDQRLTDKLPDGAPIRDMLDVLMDPTLDAPLSRTQIRDEVATFIVAGHETIASALTWGWHLLGKNPHEYELLSKDPSRAQLVFDETLRLYPPAWVITRRTLEAVAIDGFEIPSDSMVIVSPWVVHRNPQVWPEPDAFIPDRFIDGPPMLGYLPFGAGPRLCIGRDMARMQGAQILSHIAERWRLMPIHSSDVPIDASVTLRPAGGLPMRLERA